MLSQWRKFSEDLKIPDDEWKPPYPEDIEVLFRSLISPCATKVVLEPKKKGHGGAAILRAKVSFGDGPVTEDLAIKYGKKDIITTEILQYDRHVGPLPDGAAAQMRWRAETESLGAIAYSWVGDSVEDAVPFGPIKRERTSSLEWRRRREAVNRLFGVSLNPWYVAYRSDKDTNERKTPRKPLLDY